jgi:DNA-binding XRE family transcriptional regulator
LTDKIDKKAKYIFFRYIIQVELSIRIGKFCPFMSIKKFDMADIQSPLPFEVTQVALELGMHLRTARKRRRLRQGELAQKAGISEKTIRRLEQGDTGVSLGHVLSVLWAMGLLQTAKALANPETDEHGKTLELARLPERVRNSAPDNDF